MARGSRDRVVIFLDWQNLYMGARHAFHDRQASGRLGMVDPHPTRDSKGYAANRREQIAWEQAGITVVQRPMRYPKAWPAEKAQEKGVDVALAVDYVVMAVTGRYDVGILFSTDTDLIPALEAVVALGGNRGPRAEVAAWTSSRAAPRLRIPRWRLWCHYLRVGDYRGMVDLRDYTTP